MTDLQFQHRNHNLEVAGDRLTVNRETFDLGGIDRVAYWASGQKAGGSHVGTTFAVRVAEGGRSATFFAQCSGNEPLAEYEARWRQVADVLDATVLPRVAGAHIAAIDRGETVTFGGMGGVAADALGVRQRKPLAKPVPWSSIVGMAHWIGPKHRFLATDPKGGDPKPKVAVDTTAWDAVTLPTLVHHNGGRL